MTTNPSRRGWRFFPSWCGLCLLLSVALGCGGTGKVSGQVSYKGKPLAGGQVLLRPANTQLNPVTATIDPSGRYQATVPIGDVLISVDNRSLQGKGPASVGVSGSENPELAREQRRGGPPAGKNLGPPPGAIGGAMKDKNAPAPASSEKPAGTYVPIPDKYYDPTTSGITYTVKRGEQTFDIKLE